MPWHPALGRQDSINSMQNCGITSLFVTWAESLSPQKDRIWVKIVFFWFSRNFGPKTGLIWCEDLLFGLHLIWDMKTDWFWVEKCFFRSSLFSNFLAPAFRKICVRYCAFVHICQNSLDFCFWCSSESLWSRRLECAIEKNGIFALYFFFEDDNRQTVTVNSKRYVDMLRRRVIPATQRKRAIDMITVFSERMGRFLIVPTAYPRVSETVLSRGQVNFEKDIQSMASVLPRSQPFKNFSFEIT